MKGIEITGVTKRFGQTLALSDVHLTLEPERIYGLLGRNGAGKSTLLNIITNRLFADSGQVRICGLPATENDLAQQQVFMMGEQGYYPENMRVDEVFEWTERFYLGSFDRDYARGLAGQFSLDTKKRVRQLSTGYRSIYKLICALSLRVPFLLLDEPVLGLDANHRELFYRVLMENYAEHPRTIVLSTHLIEEVSRLIEEVIIIQQGRIVQKAPVEDLLRGAYAVSGPSGAVDAYTAGRRVFGQEVLGGLKTVYISGAPEGSLPANLEIGRPDLQKIFVQMTNEGGDAQ